MKVEVPTIEGTPVLLPAHEHPTFGSPGLHYHVDFRFLDCKPRQDQVIFSQAPVVMQELEMLRDSYEMVSGSINITLYLQNEYIGRSMSSCGKCPHKGLPVYNGVCTGHGLMFDKDGKVLTMDKLKLKIGSNIVVPVFGSFKYEVTCIRSEVLYGVELINLDGVVGASVPFTERSSIPVGKGDLLKLRLDT